MDVKDDIDYGEFNILDQAKKEQSVTYGAPTSDYIFQIPYIS